MSGWENLVDKDTAQLLDENDEPEEEYANEFRWRKLSQRQRLDDYQGLWRTQEPVIYAPERGPPILDFISIFAAFVVAVIAAYYTITY